MQRESSRSGAPLPNARNPPLGNRRTTVRRLRSESKAEVFTIAGRRMSWRKAFMDSPLADCACVRRFPSVPRLPSSIGMRHGTSRAGLARAWEPEVPHALFRAAQVSLLVYFFSMPLVASPPFFITQQEASFEPHFWQTCFTTFFMALP